MRIIAPTATPPGRPRQQRHVPRPASEYTAYRPCLRWDAGFTCSFCLLHESDLSPYGAGSEGAALTWIEHLEPRVRAPHLANEYENCAYSCRFCNHVRRDRPTVSASGARLLDPWRDAWGEHFALVDDRLVTRARGAAARDARYTIRLYRLNDERKVRLRRLRREIIHERIELLELDVGRLRAAARRCRSEGERQQLLELARPLAEQQRRARAELRWRSAVPADAPATCRCPEPPVFRLPDEVPVIDLDI